MVHFKEISVEQFLSDYWQKKPLVIRQALPQFINLLSPDELAGLAMEEEIESRMVFETPNQVPAWHLKRGPFLEKDFKSLAKTHWTLLVQGVDRFVPELASLFEHFNFIPQWRVDDLMISYAVEQGSVGPHYDNYDVFLYQAKGSRRWKLTTKNCQLDNYLADVDLRIMNEFQVEDDFLLEEGDMIYLPPHVGHHGIAENGDCMTYSFGYRSYQGQELLDSFAEYRAEKNQSPQLYKDPDWSGISGPGEISEQAWLNAKALLQSLLDDDKNLKAWFGCFATQLDQQAEQLLPLALEDEEYGDQSAFIAELLQSRGLIRNDVCRFAYQPESKVNPIALFINGCEWELIGVSNQLVYLLANQKKMRLADLSPFLNEEANQSLLFELWKLQWLEWLE